MYVSSRKYQKDRSMKPKVLLLTAFCTSVYLSCFCYGSIADDGITYRTIIVDQSGKGNFIRVQDAINYVPVHNTNWIQIIVRAGTYNEEVTIPQEKPFIAMEGDGREITIIQSPNPDGVFTLLADNFVARGITFTNTHDIPLITGLPVPAPAAMIRGDKAAFYECGFVGVQDTLADFPGRHYFESCYIEGFIDFIWGYGQSIYQDCSINATQSGYITAQGRENPTDTSGYVFKNCKIIATTGPVYLGRAYRQFARVIFYESELPATIAPDGWSAWENKGHENDITFSEEGCRGPGSDTSERVPWEKKLSPEEFEELTNVNAFINQDEWLQKISSFLSS